MDIFDNASALEEKQTEMALAAHFKKQKQQQKLSLVKSSASDCIECGEAIAIARQQAIQGCQYCTSCQGLIEQGKL